MKEWNFNSTHNRWNCENWYIRKEYRRVHGKIEVFYLVGNDETEYAKTFRYYHTAEAFAEKHF